MKELMDKLSKQDDGNDNEKEGKMKALKDLHKIASSMMSDDLKNLQKVTVAAKDKKGLKKGLDKAKEILGE